MDDQFLHDFRKDPRREFAESLKQKLRQQPAASPAAARSRWRPLAPVGALFAAAAVLVLLLSFPSVRVKAQQFLDLFRVQRFVAVSVNPARLAEISQLKDGKIDLKSLLSQSIQVLKEPGKPQIVANSAMASRIAGISVSLPAWLPEGVVQDQIHVEDDGALRLTASVALLQDLADALGMTDVLIPQELDGAKVTVRLPRAVLTRFSRDTVKAVLMQAATPEITLPPNVHLPELVEIYLRIAGLPLDEARRLAYAIDWRSTLLVPVPAQVASFREVDVRGAKGLLIEGNRRRGRTSTSRPPGDLGSMLLWSADNKLYCLSGSLRSTELLQMANAIQ
jgi:hypothetical protein